MQVWAQDAPEALQNNQVDFVPLNFLEGSPVKGLDMYYVRLFSFRVPLFLWRWNGQTWSNGA
jgi:hypothetical protein